jgi:hypothetical protein
VLGEALSAKLSVASSAPTTEGLKVRLTVHDEPAVTGLAVEQVVEVIVKSLAFVPARPGLLLKVSVAVPVFVRVTVMEGLVEPTANGVNCTPPLAAVGWRLTTGEPEGVPVPVSMTLCELGVALSAKFSEALSPEAVEGLKVSVTVQLPPATTGVPTLHEFAVMEKSALFVPVMAGALVKFNDAVPVFISVTIIGALVTPCVTDPNPRLAGSWTDGAVPVPLSDTLCDPGEALSAKFSVALSPPAIDGENVSVTVQLAPAFTGDAVEQVLETIMKSVAFVPVTPGLLVNVSVAFPVFINVTVICVLVEPLASDPKPRLAGSVTTGAVPVVPVPVSPTLCGLFAALSAKFSEALSVVVVDGLNVSVTVQLAPALTGDPVEHVIDTIVKSDALVPEIPGLLLKISDAPPVFISVTVSGPLVAPCGTDPNDSLAGRLTTGTVPVPVNGTLCVLGVALSAKFSEAPSAPAVVGLNVSMTVQDPPAATGVAGAHVLEVIAKSPAFAPETDGVLVNVSDAPPVFIRVTVIAALVVPSATAPNATPAGRLTPGEVPVPVKGTVCVLGVALSAKLSVAFSAAVVVGVKDIDTVHVALAATGVPVVHVVLTMAKSAALVPVMDGLLLNMREPLPVFFSVTDIGELVVCIVTVPNGSLDGRLTVGAVPDPVRATLCVLGMTLSKKVSDAVSDVLVEGLNVNVTVQLEPAPRGFAGRQVLAVIEKSAALVPVTAGVFVNVSDPAPVTVSVTVIAELVIPSGWEPNATVPGKLMPG